MRHDDFFEQPPCGTIRYDRMSGLQPNATMRYTNKYNDAWKVPIRIDIVRAMSIWALSNTASTMSNLMDLYMIILIYHFYDMQVYEPSASQLSPRNGPFVVGKLQCA